MKTGCAWSGPACAVDSRPQPKDLEKSSYCDTCTVTLDHFFKLTTERKITLKSTNFRFILHERRNREMGRTRWIFSFLFVIFALF